MEELLIANGNILLIIAQIQTRGARTGRPGPSALDILLILITLAPEQVKDELLLFNTLFKLIIFV